MTDGVSPVLDSAAVKTTTAERADGSDAGTLSSRSFSALKWNYAGTATRAAAQFLIGIVLARLLGPEAFGTVAIGWLVIGLGMLVADLGFGAALVQRRELTEQDVRFAFTAQVFLGALLSIACFAASGAVAAFFERPDAGPVVRVMGLLFVVQAFGQTGVALLRRSLDFRNAQLISIASYVVGFAAVGIPCAYAGLGAWSLVAAQLVQAASSSVLAIRRARTSLRPALRPGSRGLTAFGSTVTAANLSSWALLNLDAFLVGRLLGVVDLGLYNRAMAVVASPAGALTAGLQGVLFAASSRAQSDPTRLRRAYLAATGVVAVVALPVFLTVAVVPGAVVDGLYGGQWAAATPVLVPLALAMPLNAALALVGPVLTATGRARTELRVQALTLAFAIPVLYASAHRSLAAVAWGVLCVVLLRAFLLVSALRPVLDLRWREVAAAVAWPTGCAALVAVVSWFADGAVRGATPILRLTVVVACAGAALLTIARVSGSHLLRGPIGEFLQVEGRLPGVIRRWVRA